MKKTEKEFIIKVKAELDGARWDFQACDPRACYNDVENKAIPYLERQKFSIVNVHELVSNDWKDILYNARDQKISNEDFAKFTASHIANEIAFNRVSLFSYNHQKDNASSCKWHINETVIFHII